MRGLVANTWTWWSRPKYNTQLNKQYYEIFIDTANLAQIKRRQCLGYNESIIDG
jgi:hypothetical protein